ncbi:MAG: succinylglutamate desuccinylase/aspartoacylase family protein [Planctomycetota bacterium]
MPACPSDTRTCDRFIADHSAAHSGPTLIVVGGLHANEPAGIEAAQRLHAALTSRRITLSRGRFIALRGNLAALADEATSPWQRRRYIDEDLNRVFRTTSPDSAAESSEQTERAELSLTIQHAVREATGPVFLLDLHTVSSDSPAFVALEDSLPARRFAMCFPLPKVLGMEEVLDGLLADHATSEHGCIACIAEAGRHDDPRAVDVHESLILLALQAIGMSDRSFQTEAGEHPREVASAAAAGRSRHFYDLRQRVPIRHPSFRMNPGALAFTPVIAERTVVASERHTPLVAEHTGSLFLPNRQTEPRVGDDAFFIVTRVGRLWLSLSALLRRNEHIHKALPRLLPGVRTRPGSPHTLIIAPEYAAVLRREILHLLGYRLIRWEPAPHLSPIKRFLKAIAGITASVASIITNAFRGAERAALPHERPSDWIARRRRLDIDPSIDGNTDRTPATR